MSKKSFKIESNIYPEKFILQAIEDFSHTAKITYTNSMISIESDESHEEIFLELINYIIGIYSESSPEVL